MFSPSDAGRGPTGPLGSVSLPLDAARTCAAAYGLTATQRDALLAIQELTALDGIAPSFDEIGRELDFSSKAEVHKVVHALAQRGRIAFLPRRPRSIVVLQPIAFPPEPEIVGLFEVDAP